VGQLSQACGENKDSELLSQDETMAGTTAGPTQGNIVLVAIMEPLVNDSQYRDQVSPGGLQSPSIPTFSRDEAEAKKVLQYLVIIVSCSIQLVMETFAVKSTSEGVWAVIQHVHSEAGHQGGANKALIILHSSTTYVKSTHRDMKSAPYG